MTESRFEEAKRCPRCQKPGEETKVRHLKRGEGKVMIFTCRTSLCPWENTNWAVQIDANGEIPTLYPGPKQFEKMSPHIESMGIRYIEDVVGRDIRGERL